MGWVGDYVKTTVGMRAISLYYVEGYNDPKAPPVYGQSQGYQYDSCGAEVTGRSWCCDLFSFSADQDYSYNGTYVYDDQYHTSSAVHHGAWSFAGLNPVKYGWCCASTGPSAFWKDFSANFKSNTQRVTTWVSANVYADGTCRPSGGAND
jgi:hypothetical protein